MKLLEFALQSQKYLDSIKGKEFAPEFVRLRTESFHKYHWKLNKKGEKEYIVTISTGLDYFNYVIKYWDNPNDFSPVPKTPKTKNDNMIKEDVNYVNNFIEVLKINKNR
jgi:hypothetical protein